jgi:hypothetical protein
MLRDVVQVRTHAAFARAALDTLRFTHSWARRSRECVDTVAGETHEYAGWIRASSPISHDLRGSRQLHTGPVS